ncbi:MAG: hypothetical protein N3F09_08230 [Bacteroidia bacterium]|nr:hypothetical protein [Bacteroidia bacterium]
MNRIRQIIILTGWILPILGFPQEEVFFNWKADTTKIRIGEWVKLTLTLKCPKNAIQQYEWPVINDTLTSKVEVVSKSNIEKKEENDLVTAIQTLTVSAYDSGYFAIPPLTLKNISDSTKNKLTDALLLEVHTVPTDTLLSKTKDIKPEFDYPFKWSWYKEYFYWGLGLLALIAGIILFWYYRIKKKKKTTTQPVSLEPPHVIALRELEKVKKEAVWKENRTKEYHSLISDILRAYLERRFKFNALESTTDEIMHVMKSKVVTAEQKENLENILKLSDLVKFAKWTPLPEENERSVELAIEFVRQTLQPEPVQNHAATT